MKPGIYFVNKHADGSLVLLKEPTDMCWPDLLQTFKQFLLASGYVLPCEGDFEFVPEESENEIQL